MKKLLIVLFGVVASNVFGLNLLLNNQGAFNESATYNVKQIPGLAGWNSAPMVTYNGGTYVTNGTVQPTFESTPDVDPAWTALTVESIPAALTESYIFVGNASNVPSGVAVSGAMTMTATGAFTPVTSSFFATPSSGNTNNVLTGGQTRYCVSSVTTLNAESTATGTCTYGTAFTTGTYAVVANIIESTAGVPLAVKVTSATTTGFTYSVTNLSSTTATANPGSVNGIANGH